MSNEAPTDALRLMPIDMQIESILHDLVEEVSAAQRGARVKARARQCCARGAAKNALLNILAAAPASPLPEGGGDDDAIVDLAEAIRLLEEVAPLAICWATHYASSRGFEQHPHHKTLNDQIRAFLARNGKGEG